MSWQQFVKDNLVGTNHVLKAAILGLDGSVWAKSDDFNISDAEAHAAVRGLSNRDEVLASGLKLESDKYFVIQADPERIIGKKEANGFFIYKTAQTVIISIYNKGIQPEQCSKVTGALADYLISMGF